jgi:hypothetical protein
MSSRMASIAVSWAAVRTLAVTPERLLSTQAA